MAVMQALLSSGIVLNFPSFVSRSASPVLVHGRIYFILWMLLFDWQDASEIAATIANPIAQAFILGQSTIPPRPTYPNTSLVLQLGCPVGDEWIPQLHDNSELVDEYILEGDLPNGITFNPQAGQLTGIANAFFPKSIVSIFAINPLSLSDSFVYFCNQRSS